MEFRIADTFTASLDMLTGDEQKAVKTLAAGPRGLSDARCSLAQSRSMAMSHAQSRRLRQPKTGSIGHNPLAGRPT
jgi:hypothetical protein